MPMNTAKLLLLNVLSEGGGAAPITYLFRDEFTTDEAAPIASPRTAEPGPGTLTLLQLEGSLSISGEQLVIDGTGVTGWAKLGPYVQFARAAGRAMFTTYTRTANGAGDTSTGVGWGKSAFSADALQYGLAFSGAKHYAVNGGTFRELGDFTLGVLYKVAHVLQSTGSFLFMTEGAGNWELRWVEEITTDANPYAQLVNRVPIGTSDYLRVRDLPAPFDTTQAIATLNVASPADATEYTGDADGIIDLTVAAPGTLDGSASTRCGFYSRADSDLSPAWNS